MSQIKYTLDIEAVRNLPACRKAFKVKDSYCALGKILKGVGIDVGRLSDCHFAVFIGDVDDALVMRDWTRDVMSLNDSQEGNFQKNHMRAFNLGVERILASGIVRLKEGQKL